MSLVDTRKNSQDIRDMCREKVSVWRQVLDTFNSLADKKKFNQRNSFGIAIRDEMLIIKGFDYSEIHLDLMTGTLKSTDRLILFVDVTYEGRLEAEQVLEVVQTFKVMEEDGRLAEV